MPIEARKFTQNLLKKGFIEKEGHHRYFFHIHDSYTLKKLKYDHKPNYSMKFIFCQV